MAKPVVFPPPNCVLKPNTNTTSGVVLYILASFSLISVLGTVALPGCRTSTTYREDRNWMRENSSPDGIDTNITQRFQYLPFASSEAAGSSWTCGSWLSLCHSEEGWKMLQITITIFHNIPKPTNYHNSPQRSNSIKAEAPEFWCTLTLPDQVPHPLLWASPC